MSCTRTAPAVLAGFLLAALNAAPGWAQDDPAAPPDASQPAEDQPAPPDDTQPPADDPQPTAGDPEPVPADPEPVPPAADPQPTPPAQPAAATLDRDGILAAHNALRAKHGVAALSWSAPLEQTAQAWANGCKFEHSKGEYGENLAMWGGDGFTQASRVDDWYSEIKDYDFAKGESKNGQATGHFTQVVWKSTTSVGCGVAVCPIGTIMVCQYSPPGNYTGEYVANVPPPK